MLVVTTNNGQVAGRFDIQESSFTVSARMMTFCIFERTENKPAGDVHFAIGVSDTPVSSFPCFALSEVLLSIATYSNKGETMFRRMILSIFGGALLAVALTFSQTAMGACRYDGIDWCPATLPNGQTYDSCLVTFTCPPAGECYISGLKCLYTGVTIIE
jgi:hypothetical protein